MRVAGGGPPGRLPTRDLRVELGGRPTQPSHDLNPSWDRDLIFHGDAVDTAREPSCPSFAELGLQRTLAAGPCE